MNKRKILAGAVIEFVLIAPFLVLLLDGIVEFGVIMYDKALITDASRAGARWGIVLRSGSFASSTQVQTYTVNYLTGKLINFSATTTNPVATATKSSATPSFANADTLTVKVTYAYTPLLLQNFITLDPTITLSSTTVMTYE